MRKGGVQSNDWDGKGFAYAATYLKLLSTKIIFIWSSLRAEYAQMMFKEHKQVNVGRSDAHCLVL